MTLTLTSDFVVVGSGLTGATIARLLHNAGAEVAVLERRSHVGGNVYDHVHESGIRVHTYGPHYFRTNSERLWAYVQEFGAFYRYEGVIKSHVDGRYENWPVSGSYVRDHIGADWSPSFVGSPSTFEEACLSMMPEAVYRKFVRGYTEKQWGVPAAALSPALAGRFEIHEDDDPRLKRHKYQGIPFDGYAQWMSRMLDGIPVICNCDFLQNRDSVVARKLLVFTGPIDEYFGFSLGRLVYRGQRRTDRYLSDVEYALPCGQVNFPDVASGPAVRVLEWKHMMPRELADRAQGTLLTSEVPFTPSAPEDFEYPFPDEANSRLYESYKALAAREPSTLVCGRLGEYKYYDMDQAIGRALMLGQRILDEH